MSMFRVYFKDGNQRLFEAGNVVALINYIVYELNENPDNITKIENLSE